MAKAADIVVQCLENESVKYVFGIPGEENLDLLESLRKSQIKRVLTRHEQSRSQPMNGHLRNSAQLSIAASQLGPLLLSSLNPQISGFSDPIEQLIARLRADPGANWSNEAMAQVAKMKTLICSGPPSLAGRSLTDYL
ncbi:MULTISPECIES: thiamine pyrophosphate-binding protein [Pseudomonas]|uniref:thiamine pyrophosphate-binding protein n=1 Tax=Pseudomonas TaxID=286 RepID=UPI001CECBF46|nr:MULTISPECIES: thiamine pyrophosphate-binding protein [Pseudomonas]